MTNFHSVTFHTRGKFNGAVMTPSKSKLNREDYEGTGTSALMETWRELRQACKDTEEGQERQQLIVFYDRLLACGRSFPKAKVEIA